MIDPARLVLYFFIYALLGWCAEVAFAAVKERALVNRGFLNGPLCPIYGFGMVGLLAVLGGWRRNLLAVFFIGMALATLLELVVGYLLYRLFHTRWWDYSQNRGNLGGFICPKFSLLWGAASVAVVMGLHPLLAAPVERLPRAAVMALDVLLGLCLLVDTSVSFAQAAGLGRQLRRLDEMADSLRRASDAMTEIIGEGAMTADTLLDEQKLQWMLAKMEGRDNAAALREQLLALAGRARALRSQLEHTARQRYFGTGRLLRAYPHMVTAHREALARLRALARSLRAKVDEHRPDGR